MVAVPQRTPQEPDGASTASASASGATSSASERQAGATGTVALAIPGPRRRRSGHSGTADKRRPAPHRGVRRRAATGCSGVAFAHKDGQEAESGGRDAAGGRGVTSDQERRGLRPDADGSRVVAFAQKDREQVESAECDATGGGGVASGRESGRRRPGADGSRSGALAQKNRCKRNRAGTIRWAGVQSLPVRRAAGGGTARTARAVPLWRKKGPDQAESGGCGAGERRPRATVTRAIPAAVRRHVWLRDRGRCTYRDPVTGRCCGARHLLQIDHIEPFAIGGANSEGNLRLLCAAHNRARGAKPVAASEQPLPGDGLLLPQSADR